MAFNVKKTSDGCAARNTAGFQVSRAANFGEWDEPESLRKALKGVTEFAPTRLQPFGAVDGCRDWG
jgi:hypothetical protein